MKQTNKDQIFGKPDSIIEPPCQEKDDIEMRHQKIVNNKIVEYRYYRITNFYEPSTNKSQKISKRVTNKNWFEFYCYILNSYQLDRRATKYHFLNKILWPLKQSNNYHSFIKNSKARLELNNIMKDSIEKFIESCWKQTHFYLSEKKKNQRQAIKRKGALGIDFIKMEYQDHFKYIFESLDFEYNKSIASFHQKGPETTEVCNSGNDNNNIKESFFDPSEIDNSELILPRKKGVLNIEHGKINEALHQFSIFFDMDINGEQTNKDTQLNNICNFLNMIHFGDSLLPLTPNVELFEKHKLYCDSPYDNLNDEGYDHWDVFKNEIRNRLTQYQKNAIIPD